MTNTTDTRMLTGCATCTHIQTVHSAYVHDRGTGACLVPDCTCKRYVDPADTVLVMVLGEEGVDYGGVTHQPGDVFNAPYEVVRLWVEAGAVAFAPATPARPEAEQRRWRDWQVGVNEPGCVVIDGQRYDITTDEWSMLVRGPDAGAKDKLIDRIVRMYAQDDQIDHPAHYGGADDPYEPIKIIEAKRLGFHEGNALKYILRAGYKPGESRATDLRKAAWYLNRLADLEDQQ